MARTPDKPGTYRIKPKGNGYLLSGVRSDGSRVKIPVGSKAEGETMAATVFAGIVNSGVQSGFNAVKTAATETIDDWGLDIGIKRVDEAAATASAQTFGVKVDPPNQVSAVTPADPEAREKAEKRKKNAKSLMEVVGMGWAAGDIYVARRLVERAGKVPVNPSPKQVNELADSVKDTLTDWFGDREIAPWQMAILLSLSIPMVMLIQSRAKPVLAENAKTPDLKSVP